MLGQDAGNAYFKAAELYKTAPDLQYESSKSFENAAKCLKRMDARGMWACTRIPSLLWLTAVHLASAAAIDALQCAIQVDKESANFRNAAKHHQEIAEIYESEIIDLNGAKDNWEQAANLYMADDSPA